LKFVLERVKFPRRCFYVFMFLCFLVLFEILLPPMNVNLTPLDAYLWLKNQPGDFIVAEFPPQTDHSESLYQRVHGKRLFNPVRENPQDILHAPADQVSEQALIYRDIRERPQDMLALGVKYIIFHEDDPFLPFNLGYFKEPQFKVVYRAQGITVYEIVNEIPNSK